MYVCMYVCMYGGCNLKVGWNIVCMCVCMYVCMYVCIHVWCMYVSQGDFRLMSFTAGRCGTPLIPNDQLRRNGVRSSDLIVSVSPSRPSVSESRSRRTPIGGRAKRVRRCRTESPRRPSEARLPASDRKDFTNRTALIVRYCFDPATTSSVVYGVYVGTEWGPQIRLCVSITSRSRSKIRINVRKPIQNSNDDLKTPLDARWCRATNAKCITYLARGLYRPTLRRTQLETHEHKVKFKRKSIAAVNCPGRRP